MTATLINKGIKHLVEIETADGKITATQQHPFWMLAEKYWVDAKDLQVGSVLQTAAGAGVEVTSIKKRIAVKRVYNLTIDDLHTYHVIAGGTSVLVHNTNENCLVTQTLGAGPYAREGVGLVNGNINDRGVITLVNESGNKHGCHTCGAKEPGTKHGSWVRDHQPPTAIAGRGPQTAYPQCMACMRQQGGMVRQLREENYDFDR